ncbi:MAG: phosphoribosylanthranilate isomerase [Acidobacteriota bacterium]|nr:phosphoribosylanthranilate isomerase [Acidobacteriota bacterium]
MRRVRIKICGITKSTDMRRAIECGADFLGFNFYPGSPRYVTPAKAGRMIKQMPKGVAAVGVFVNEPEEKVLAIARRVGLKYLQLHGDESPAEVARLARAVPVIKAIRVKKPFRATQIVRYRRASALLLDGFDRRLRGGTGKTFDWKIARRISSRARIFIAGGLAPDNVAEAVRIARPYAVDVSSGVESRPGKKDPARLKAFARAVRQAQRNAS